MTARGWRPGLAAALAASILGVAASVAFRVSEPVPLLVIETEGFTSCGEGCFRGSGGDGLHLLAAEIAPRAGDDYTLQLDVLRLPGVGVDLSADFFAPGYDDGDQEESARLDMRSLERGVTLRWNAGDAPERARVRVFYTGPGDVEIGGLQLAHAPRAVVPLGRLLAGLGVAALCVAVALCGLETRRRITLSHRRAEAPALIALWLGLVLLRLLPFRATPLWGGDEYAYKSLAAALYWLGEVAALDPDRIAHPVAFPNLVYPVLIAPAFAFETGFRGLLQAINAALICAAVFPAYRIARRFLTREWSLAFAAYAAVIPFTSLGAFAVTEVAFYPFFLLWAWASLRALEPGASPLALACAGALVGLLANVRPNGAVLLPTVVLALLVAARTEGRPLGATLRQAFLVLPGAFVLAAVVLQWATHRGAGVGIGIYGFMLGGSGATAGFPVADHVDLVLGHLAGLAVPYALPLVLVATGLVSVVRGRWQGDGARFATLTALAMASLVGVALSFTLTVATFDLGGLGRWHARYYFVATPLVLLAGVVAAKRPGFGGVRERSVVLGATALVLVAGGVFVFGRAASQSPWFGSIVDGMDARWLRRHEWGYALFAVAAFAVAALVCAGNRSAPVAAAAGLAAWLAVAHSAVFHETRLGKSDPAADCGLAASLVLQNAPGRFAIATARQDDANRVGFTIPYLPERVAWGDDVARERGTGRWPIVDYVVSYGGVAAPTGGRPVLDAGECRVYRTR